VIEVQRLKKVRRISNRQRGAVGVDVLLSISVAVVVLGLFVAYQFVDPAPPRQIVLATGADGGA